MWSRRWCAHTTNRTEIGQFDLFAVIALQTDPFCRSSIEASQLAVFICLVPSALMQFDYLSAHGFILVNLREKYTELRIEAENNELNFF